MSLPQTPSTSPKHGQPQLQDFTPCGEERLYAFYRNIETIDALGNSTYTAYDPRGNVVKTWGATYPVWYEYDDHGRMIAMATTRDPNLVPDTIIDLNDPTLDKTQWLALRSRHWSARPETLCRRQRSIIYLHP